MNQINEEDFLKRIQAGEKIEATDAMPEEYRNALLQLLEARARGELLGAYGLSEGLAKAPSIQEKLVVAQIVKDEVRHAGVFYKCLEELGVDVENRIKELDQAYGLTHVESKKSTSNIEEKNNPNPQIETWEEFIMVNFCVDRYLAHHLADGEKSSYNPLAKACQSVLREEMMHISHGDMGVEQLAKDPKTRQEVQRVLNKWFPKTLNQFGPADSPRYKIRRKWCLIVRDLDEIQEDFRKEIKERVVRAGLQMPLWTPGGHKKTDTQESRLLPKIKRKILSFLPR
jgi:ring-1,2-phenylacetyl-CoA epoxidase subunit PaaA